MALFTKLMSEIKLAPELKDLEIFCHAQITARGYWEKCGFTIEGEMFSEADIDHYKMVY